MTNQQDHIYIERILKGDSTAFTFLVEKYQSMVFTMALRMLGNREEAEDAAQDAFIKCYKSLQSFKGDSKFSTWMYKIIYHCCLDRIKKNKKMMSSEIIEEVHEGDVGLVEDALAYLEHQERSEMIQQAISQLATEDQMIITLYYFEEKSLKEIAEVVDISMDNIKIRLFRSRKKLFSLLKGRLEPLTERL